MNPMLGHLNIEGRMVARGGFLHPAIGPAGVEMGTSHPIYTRSLDLPQNVSETLGMLQRGEVTGDVNQVLQQLGMSMGELQRAITSGMTAFPTRENLEAEAKVLVPLDTPVRNLLPRRPGSGKASNWKQLTSLGGGWAAGDQPGEGPGALQAFFSESGAPVEHTSVYADKSASYKLLGSFGKVTGFAMASGANFQNQLAVEKTNAINNLMLNEENALINGNSASTAAPWGDGATALSFDGLVNLIATANGVPAAQVQTTVGALTKAHIDAQLTRIWQRGGKGMYVVMNAQEVNSLVHLAEADGSIIRVQASSADGQTVLGVKVTGIVHPVSGEVVDIFTSRFLAAGTIIYGARFLPDGSPAADVEVLPQVQLPELAPNENVQGYTAQEIAPSLTAPQVYAFLVSVYEVLRMKGATVFAKSTGVTAV